MKKGTCPHWISIPLLVGTFALSLSTALALGWNEIRNLGPGVNTEGDEGGPQVTYDGGRLLYYSNHVSDCGVGGYDIYVATGSYDTWQICCEYSCVIPVGTSADERAPTMTADYASVYFGSNASGGFGGMDLYVTHHVDAWGPPENLGAPVNTSGNEEMPYVTPDGSALYFGSDAPGGYGGHDLWISDPVGSTPVNLGSVVNTAANEKGPSLSMDGNILVFSSDRGGNPDIYYSEKVDGEWTPPVNAGPVVNGSDAETCPSLGPSLELYFRSTREGNGDMFIAIPVAVPTRTTTWGAIKELYR